MKNFLTHRNRVITHLLFMTAFIYCVFYLSSVIPSAHAQLYPKNEVKEPSEPYRESALRRFEIVSISSLPFTTIHSYLAVRGIRMATQSKFAPKLSDADYKIMGASAVAFSVFIGFWDWLHTRDADTSELIMPQELQQPKKPEDSEQLREYGLREETSSPIFVVQLFQVRFK